MTQQPAKIETVTLTGAHTHKGRRCNKGDKIEVLPHQKAFLAQRNKIAGAEMAQAKEPAKK